MTQHNKLPGLQMGQDILAALAVAALALVAIVKARALDYGSLAEIGPGLFPTALAVILVGLCLWLALASWRSEALSGAQSALDIRFNGRALGCIIGGLCVFAVTIRGLPLGTSGIPALGVVGATPLAILLAGLADPDTRWAQLGIFAVGLTAFCTVLFRFLLGLPLPVAPFVLGY